MTTEPQIQPLPSYRQSILRSLEMCGLRTRAELLRGTDYTVGYGEKTADLGVVAHVCINRCLQELRASGEPQISTAEMDELMYSVLAEVDIVLPAEDREDLRWMLYGFCHIRWQPSRFIALEAPYELDIACPDGVVRKLTGRPDLVIADPPKGIICVDYKSGKGQPRDPREKPPEGEPIVGKQYLSDRGHYQGDVYSLLLLSEHRAADYCIFRELHLRSGEFREARITREEVEEHVSTEIAIDMQQLDRAIAEGPDSKLWTPRPGRHCLRACPVTKSCPVPQEQRGLGSFGDRADADAQARRYAVVDALRTQLRDGLKVFYEEDGYAPKIGDGREMRWRYKPDGGRAFGPCDPDEPRSRAEAEGRREAG